MDKKVAEIVLMKLRQGTVQKGAAKVPALPSSIVAALPSSVIATTTLPCISKRSTHFSPVKLERSLRTILGGILAKSCKVYVKLRTKSQQAVIDNLPGWMDKDIIAVTIFGQKKRSQKDESRNKRVIKNKK